MVPTARRYVAAAQAAGLDRSAGLDAVDDALVGAVVNVVRPVRPNGHGQAWEALLAREEQIRAWIKGEDGKAGKVGRGLSIVKIEELLARQGCVVPYRTLHRFATERCGCRAKETTVRVADGEPGMELQVDFGHMGQRGFAPAHRGVWWSARGRTYAPIGGSVEDLRVLVMSRSGRWLAVGPTRRSELVMTLPRSVAEVLGEHVLFEVECIDRMYLNVYVPELQRTGQVVGFLMRHRGFPIASTALVAPMSRKFVTDIKDYAATHDVPLVRFKKGQRKDDVMHEHLASFTGTDEIVFIGVAEEKAHVFRTERRHNPTTGAPYPWIVTSTAVVNHYYFYGVDDDFGPFFLKFCSYFPYTARLCINGNEYAKRQATKAGIDYEPLDNGFAAVADPTALQAICDGLDEDKIEALLRKWLARLPHPYPAADRAAGYRYDVSVLQAEFSLTQMLDQPVSGRVFFEQVIRDNLDLGRPDRVQLIFDRRIFRGRKHPTPSRFRTRVITQHVTPSLYVDYKHTTIKQYHKEGRALRTETTINDTYDFNIGRRLTNLPALRRIGFSANRRLLDVQRLSHDPADGTTTLTEITEPVQTETGQRVAGMRYTDERVQALLSVLCLFRLLPRGFTNRDLREHLEPLLARAPGTLTSGQGTYDLRRLRHHGLIERIPHTHRYRVTADGHQRALFLSRTHHRILRDGLAELASPVTAPPTRLRAVDRAYEAAIDDLLTRAGIAA